MFIALGIIACNKKKEEEIVTDTNTEDSGNDTSDCVNTVSDLSIKQTSSYTSPDGKEYTSSGIYTAILTNAAGCDSVITIDLEIEGTVSDCVNTASNLSIRQTS